MAIGHSVDRGAKLLCRMSCIVHGTSLSVLKRRYSNIPLVNTSEARLGVFWDVQSCGVPDGLSVRDVARNITKFLRKGGHNEPITTFRAYEDAASTVILNLQEQWNRFSVIDGDNSVEVSVVKPPWIGKAIVTDIFGFALNNSPPSKILLCSTKTDVAAAMLEFKKRGYVILLGHPTAKVEKNPTLPLVGGR